ncbi:hypothetical protein EYF80_005981 [Liparis tanakae]|uniref:Uncharacterized protein n=1 Tax=Liparis tanakae TaxID=230148 RepID=A0A4Z2J0F0_9TELE|nr:hypothetical protein EYF80_005981 [Liparis tanakae]
MDSLSQCVAGLRCKSSPPACSICCSQTPHSSQASSHRYVRGLNPTLPSAGSIQVNRNSYRQMTHSTPRVPTELGFF